MGTNAISMPGSPLGINWGMVYGQPFSAAEEFMPQVRQLGAGFSRVILFWSQLGPVEGTFNWAPLDTYLAQLNSADEGMLTLYCASPWATRTSAWFLPASPPIQIEAYSKFITALVKRCDGRIRYFQNDSEPNSPTFWSGTPAEFSGHLHTFADAVRSADPMAKIVLGGFDGLFDPTGKHTIPGQEKGIAFFDFVIANSAADYDIFDLHLYADPYTIPARVNYVRQKMQEHGYERPIIAVEYNGPGFFEFPANRKYFALMSDFFSKESKGVRDLYDNPKQLAAETQLFLMDASAPIEARMLALQQRDLVIRNVLAFWAGVQKTAFWDLWHETRHRDQVKTLLYGKLFLMEHEDDRLKKMLPLGKAYQQMASQLADVQSVTRVDLQNESLYAFLIERKSRAPLYVFWNQNQTEPVVAHLPQLASPVFVTFTPVFVEVDSM